MPMRRDISIWLAILTQIILNIRMQEICSVQEVSNTAPIEHISQMVVATLTVAHLLFALTVVVNVWVATLSHVAKSIWQKEDKVLIKE